jgi:broad specificity phosphatase PhoE/predicted kinase
VTLPVQVIVLRGLPGIGKTTVSALLRDHLQPAVRISVDTLRYLARPRDLNQETIALGEHAAAAMAETYVGAGHTAIIEGVFADRPTLDALVGRLRLSGTAVAVVTLTGTLNATLARNQAREHEMRVPDDRIAALHAGFDAEVGLVVDTAEYVAEEVAEIVEERLAADPPPPPLTESGQTILYLRHGAAAVPAGRYPDHETMSLSSRGREQVLGARDAIRRLEPHALVVSPLLRARETAELLADALGLEAIVDERLRERTFPELYGLAFDEIARRWGPTVINELDWNSDHVDIPGAETLDAACARVLEAIANLAGLPHRRILVVGHGGPHGWICSAVFGAGSRLGRAVELGPARMSAFSSGRGEITRVRALNAPPAGLLGWV